MKRRWLVRILVCLIVSTILQIGLLIFGHEMTSYVPGKRPTRVSAVTSAYFRIPSLLLNFVIWPTPMILFWLIHDRQKWRRRREGGQCVNCGYDLRGDMAAGCPECGWGREGGVVPRS
jgi:hypothetical protein